MGTESDTKALWDVLDAAGARIKKLEAALLPFARYAKQQAKSWTQHNDCVFYGIKRPGAHQITYGDFRRAANLMRRLLESQCTVLGATTRASLTQQEGSREKSNVTTQQASTAPSVTRESGWSSMNMMASRLSDLNKLLSASDSGNESAGTNPKDLGLGPSVGRQTGKLAESVVEIAREQRLQIAILAAEFGHRACEQGHSREYTLAKVMEILDDEGSYSDSRR